MDLGLAGRTAFVAGASSGLGFAVAHELVSEGCRVAICSRSRERIDDAAERLGDSGGTSSVLPLVCDVTDEESIKTAVEETISTFGTLNILVTNAGGPPSGFIDDFSSDQWRDAFELNLMSTINLCRAALSHLREAASASDPLARILMITSVSAKQPIPNLYLSNAARAGVQGFAKSLSEELGPAGITVNTILPGYTRTDRLKNLAGSITKETGKPRDEIESEWAENAALKRIADPAEFAAAAVFLVSKRASYVTGIAFPVDGGRVKHLL
jgi:3-oxoacyl-[acyl-carrier protein] reductase